MDFRNYLQRQINNMIDYKRNLDSGVIEAVNSDGTYQVRVGLNVIAYRSVVNNSGDLLSEGDPVLLGFLNGDRNMPRIIQRMGDKISATLDEYEINQTTFYLIDLPGSPHSIYKYNGSTTNQLVLSEYGVYSFCVDNINNLIYYLEKTDDSIYRNQLCRVSSTGANKEIVTDKEKLDNYNNKNSFMSLTLDSNVLIMSKQYSGVG